MFRKPKRPVKGSLRSKANDEEDDVLKHENVDVGNSSRTRHDDGDEYTSQLIQEARKRVKTSTGTGVVATTATMNEAKKNIMHSYKSSQNDDITKKQKDLVTSTADYHPSDLTNSNKGDGVAGIGEDGIFRNQQRNKFHAGPVRASANVRVTARFDYQPDICKDYKETGFCGYGDTCIYLHDRGDTMTGWQLEQQWEEQQKLKKQQQEKEMNYFVELNENDRITSMTEIQALNKTQIATDDGIPFACFICRAYFKNPVVTKCNHYFCESCIMDNIRGSNTDACPVCGNDTNSVFNEPTKLINKKKKILGTKQAKANGSWEAYFEAFSNKVVAR